MSLRPGGSVMTRTRSRSRSRPRSVRKPWPREADPLRKATPLVMSPSTRFGSEVRELRAMFWPARLRNRSPCSWPDRPSREAGHAAGPGHVQVLELQEVLRQQGSLLRRLPGDEPPVLLVLVDLAQLQLGPAVLLVGQAVSGPEPGHGAVRGRADELLCLPVDDEVETVRAQGAVVIDDHGHLVLLLLEGEVGPDLHGGGIVVTPHQIAVEVQRVGPARGDPHPAVLLFGELGKAQVLSRGRPGGDRDAGQVLGGETATAQEEPRDSKGSRTAGVSGVLHDTPRVEKGVIA